MPKTLLLADDSVTIQKVVGISFANEDIVLLTVDNGDDAITRTRDARPDIVLADVVMPGKNGYDVCQAIKADASLAHIPVLLLTGTFEAFDEQRAARVGADGHITKPFEAQSLVDQVNALLARPAPGSSPPPTEVRAEGGAAPIGALRPARAPHQPVSHTADTAYDFFDAEVTATRSTEAPDQTPQQNTILFGGTPVTVNDAPRDGEPAPRETFSVPDSASVLPTRAPNPVDSGFGSEALDVDSSPFVSGESLFDDFEPPAAEAPTATAPPRPDPTPSDPMGWNARSESQPSDAFDWDVQGEPEVSATNEWDAPAAPASDGAIDFEANTQPEPSPPPSLGWDLAGDPAPALRSENEVPDWFSPTSDPGVTHEVEAPGASMSSPAAPARPVFEPPAHTPGGFDLDGPLDEVSSFGDAVMDPDGARDYDVSSSDLGLPRVSAPTPEPPSRPIGIPMPSPRISPPPAEPAPSFAASAPAASAALPERERRELHDALEKLAWEAFGPVAESLVREAVERIERIAWEVIPQLAESLIKEELRKLKGE